MVQIAFVRTLPLMKNYVLITEGDEFLAPFETDNICSTKTIFQ